jgi:hypothetical protein
VGPGASFGSQTLRVHVGLDDATAVTSVEVQWPGRTGVQVFRRLRIDAHHRLREGDAMAAAIERPRVTWSTVPSSRRHEHMTTPERP